MPAQVQTIDHTADIGLRVHADNPGDAFCAAAEGMFDIMVDRSHVEPSETWDVRVEASDWDELLVVWLEELLYLYESKGLIVSGCKVRRVDSEQLVAELSGESIDLARHDTKVQIKAITYHKLLAEQTPQGFVIQVIFDI